MRNVTIADYGVGNLHSVAKAVLAGGGNPVLVQSPEELLKADIIILPGVGAFDHCVTLLKENNLWDALIEVVTQGKPLLGICVGMQMLLSQGEEFGGGEGFGFIPGVVSPIPSVGGTGVTHKIPHVGWSELLLTKVGKKNKIFTNLEDNKSTYFVHSFAAQPDKKDDILAFCNYNGVEICAAVGRDNIIGFQFHPEKSGKVGIDLLESFITG